jgi:hypothetical protein
MQSDYRTLAEYENLKKRQIKQSWCEDQERILKIWAEKASGWAWLHEKSSRYYNKLTNMYTYTSIILSTMAGGLGFMIGGQQNADLKSGEADIPTSRGFTFAIGIMNITSAILVSIQKFVRSSENAEMHSHMNKMFSSFCRKIVLELSLQRGDRKECIEFCKQCRDEYDKLVNDAPEVPMSVIQHFQREFDTANYVPEIANGLVHFEGLDHDDISELNDLGEGSHQRRTRRRNSAPPGSQRNSFHKDLVLDINKIDL